MAPRGGRSSRAGVRQPPTPETSRLESTTTCTYNLHPGDTGSRPSSFLCLAPVCCLIEPIARRSLFLDGFFWRLRSTPPFGLFCCYIDRAREPYRSFAIPAHDRRSILLQNTPKPRPPSAPYQRAPIPPHRPRPRQLPTSHHPTRLQHYSLEHSQQHGL